MRRGIFISVEGHDGAGKTSNIDYIRERVERQGYETVVTREPGGTQLAEQLRSLVLQEGPSPIATTLMFMAARNDHVEKVIKPAVKAGKAVITDRYMLSTYAYQGYGQGLKNALHWLELFAHGNFLPDYTLLFQVDEEIAHERLSARNGVSLDRFDSATREFKRRVRDGYEDAYLSKLVPNIELIDANGDLESVRRQIDDWSICKIPYVGE